MLINKTGVFENETSPVQKSRAIDEVLGGEWVQEEHNLANNNDRSRRSGSNTGYASVLQGESSEFIGSPAFRNVVENLFGIQERKLIAEDVGITADDQYNSVYGSETDVEENFSIENDTEELAKSERIKKILAEFEKMEKITSSSKKKRYACHKKLVFGEQQNSWGYPTIRCPAGGEAKRSMEKKPLWAADGPTLPTMG